MSDVSKSKLMAGAYMLRGLITQMSPAQQETIHQMVADIQAIIGKDPEAGMIAVALVSAERASGVIDGEDG